MDAAHIHLLINHLPIFGSLLGAMVLAHGLYARSDATKLAGYNVFVLSSIGAVIAYITGEGADKAVKGLPGVLESRIEAHEEFAAFSLVILIILGLAALIANFLTMRKPQLSKTIAFTILVIALISFGMVARTGYLGGQIRHTELNSVGTAPAGTINGLPSQGDYEDGDED